MASRGGPNRRKAKPKSYKSYSRNSSFAIQDSADCSRCGQKSWAHRRCDVCNGFVWCTDVDTSITHHKHRDCSKILKIKN